MKFMNRHVAARRLDVVLELRAETVAQGLSVAHDVDLRAPVTVAGGGLYSGGSIRGREWLTFTGGQETSATDAPDGVHGDVWPLAGVHALGSIWAAEEEVHAAQTAPRYSADSDFHTGAGPVEALTAPLEPAALAALAEIAQPAAGALTGGVLDLSRLPMVPPPAQEAASAAEGYVIVVAAAAEGPVYVQGERPQSACPVAVVLEGDAVVGASEAVTALRGAVVVCGRLLVAGPAALEGHLWAQELTVDAPLTLVTPAGWRAMQLPGLSRPILLAAGR